MAADTAGPTVELHSRSTVLQLLVECWVMEAGCVQQQVHVQHQGDPGAAETITAAIAAAGGAGHARGAEPLLTSMIWDLMVAASTCSPLTTAAAAEAPAGGSEGSSTINSNIVEKLMQLAVHITSSTAVLVLWWPEGPAHQDSRNNFFKRFLARHLRQLTAASGAVMEGAQLHMLVQAAQQEMNRGWVLAGLQA